MKQFPVQEYEKELPHCAREEWRFGRYAADTVVNATMTAGVGALGEKAPEEIDPELRRGKAYAQAAAAGYDHPEPCDRKLFDPLP